MLEARRSNAADLSLTSSTSLDDSCDSYSADYEEGCSRPLQCGSSNREARKQRAAAVRPQQVGGAKNSSRNRHGRPPLKPSASKEETVKRSEFQHQLDRAVHEKQGGIPVAIRYFTRKAEEERARRDAESRRRAIENMSEAHRHFMRLAIENYKQHKGVAATMREVGSPKTPKTKRAWRSAAAPPRSPRPAAMEHFARKGAAAGGGQPSHWAGEVIERGDTVDTDDLEEK